VYGGTVIAQRLFQGNIIGTSRPKVEFDGGLLQAVYGTNANGFMYGALDVRLKAGGITIDSAGYTLPVFPAFLADAGSPGGGVTKSGPGDLRLLGANTYTGPSVVNNGALILSTASTGDGAATAHDGTGFGAALAAAGSTLHLSSLILGDNAGATNEYELGVFGNPTTPVIQAASLAVNGTIYVNIHGGGLSLGRFTLIQFGSKTGTGAFLLNTLPPGIGAELAVDADSVDLLITTAPSLRWVGPGINNNWNTNSTELAWYDDLASTFKSFTDGMPVLFNDNAANGVVNISAAVAPASVTMTNASLAYTFNGPGNIIGAAFLSKFGAGTLLMATSNDYSGHTTIGAGTFRLGTNNVIPSGAGRGNVTLDGTLDLAGFNDRLNGLSGSGIIDNSAAGAVLLVIGDNVSGGTFSGLFTNSGGALTLNKVGGGTLTLAGPVRITGGITNSGGNLIISHTHDYRGGNLCHRRFLAGWQ
jgi:autotransporter-associated beta strand protein